MSDVIDRFLAFLSVIPGIRRLLASRLTPEETQVAKALLEHGECAVTGLRDIPRWVVVDGSALGSEDPSLAARYLHALHGLWRKGIADATANGSYHLTRSGTRVAEEATS
jgi:hypothetical protein